MLAFKKINKILIATRLTAIIKKNVFSNKNQNKNKLKQTQSHKV
jgi:hypothetical protein